MIRHAYMIVIVAGISIVAGCFGNPLDKDAWGTTSGAMPPPGPKGFTCKGMGRVWWGCAVRIQPSSVCACSPYDVPWFTCDQDNDALQGAIESEADIAILKVSAPGSKSVGTLCLNTHSNFRAADWVPKLMPPQDTPMCTCGTGAGGGDPSGCQGTLPTGAPCEQNGAASECASCVCAFEDDGMGGTVGYCA